MMGKGFMQFATGALSGFNENAEMEYKRIADLDKMRVQTIQQRAMEFDKERSAYSNKIGAANQALKSLVDGGVDPRVANRAIEMWLSTGNKDYIDPATVHASFKVEEVADPKSFKPSPGEGETHQLVQPGQASAFRAPIPQAPNLDAMVAAGGSTHLRPGDVNAYKAMFNTEGLPNLERAPEPQNPYAIRYVSPQMQARTRAFGLEALRTVVNMAKDFEGLRNPDTALTLWQKLTGITDPRFFPPREAFAALSSYRSEGSAREKEMSQRINATALFIQERFGKSPEQAKKEAMQLVYGVGVDITSDGELVGKGEVKDANKLKINGELATAQITADINRLGFTPENAEAYHQALTSLGPNEQRNWRLNEATKAYERISSNVRQAENADAKNAASNDAINRAAEMAGGRDKLTPDQIAAIKLLKPGEQFKLVPGGIEIIKGGGGRTGLTAKQQLEADANYEALRNIGMPEETARTMSYNSALTKRNLDAANGVPPAVVDRAQKAKTNALRQAFGLFGNAKVFTDATTGEVTITGLDDRWTRAYNNADEYATTSMNEALRNAKGDMTKINPVTVTKEAVKQSLNATLREELFVISNTYRSDNAKMLKEIENYGKELRDPEIRKLWTALVLTGQQKGLLPKPGEPNQR